VSSGHERHQPANPDRASRCRLSIVASLFRAAEDGN